MQPFHALVPLLLIACSGGGDGAPEGGSHGAEAGRSNGEAAERLRAWSDQVEHGVVEVRENVFAVLGYTHSVNSMIVGEDGVIIIDPGHDPEASMKVREAFEQITTKPVRAVIYTHGHIDHTRGTRAFIDAGAGDGVEIWARSNFNGELIETLKSGLKTWVRPAFTQGGDLRDDELFIPPGHPRPPSPEQQRPRDAGQGGPKVEVVMAPTQTFDGERVELEIAGVKLELVAAPGETDDQLFVWLPEERVLFAGDNISHSWPNVYSIRGAQRDIRDWIASLDKMVARAPEAVIPGHGNPILEGAVLQLENRRDAMQWVYDATIAGINARLTPDEVVERVQLPERFAELDYLADYYGALEYCVRQIYTDRVGWFGGDPLELFAGAPDRQSARMAQWLGGEAALLEAARTALAEGDAYGAAQLAQHAMRLRPADPEPKRLMAAALEVLAEGSINSTARYYTLSYRNRLLKSAAEGR